MSAQAEPLQGFPLPPEALPEALRRFCGSDVPAPARLMASRGMVPVKGAELLVVLCQLAHDPDPAVVSSASKTLADMPENVIGPLLEGEVHAAVLHFLGTNVLSARDDLLERIVANAGVHDVSIQQVATRCSERIGERIALNEARLLRYPAVVESLFKNRNTRMSTCDRMIELCARNGVRVHGIPQFEAIAESLGAQLIPEPSEEPLPGDAQFASALTDEDEDAYEESGDVKKKHANAAVSIGQMSLSEKIRAATVGSAVERSILIRDANRMVAMSVVESPRVVDAEAVRYAQSKNVSEDVLRGIANRRDLVRLYGLKVALCFNPKTPLNVTLGLLTHLRENDLRNLAKSKGVQAGLTAAAKNALERRAKR